jgi:hypothetical protein
MPFSENSDYNVDELQFAISSLKNRSRDLLNEADAKLRSPGNRR